MIQPPTGQLARQHEIYKTTRYALPSSYGLRVYHRIREGDDVQDVLSSAPDGSSARYPTVIEVAPGGYYGSFCFPTNYAVIVAPLGGATFWKDDDAVNYMQEYYGSLGIADNDASTFHAGCSGIEDATALDPVVEQWVLGLKFVNSRTGAGSGGGSPPEPALSIGGRDQTQKWAHIRLINNWAIGSHDGLQIFHGPDFKAYAEVGYNLIMANHDPYTIKAPGIQLYSHHNIIRSLSADMDTKFSSLLPTVSEWKCTAIHVNYGDALIDTRMHFQNESLHARAEDWVSAAGEQSGVAGILAYSSFVQGLGGLKFEDCSVLVEYDIDQSPTWGVNGVQLRDVTIPQGKFAFSGDIDVRQLNTGDDAPDKVSAVSIVPDEVAWLDVRGHAHASNAKGSSDAYAIDADGSDSHVRHALYSDQEINIENSADVAAMSLAAVP